jgi:hypothetical protein
MSDCKLPMQHNIRATMYLPPLFIHDDKLYADVSFD